MSDYIRSPTIFLLGLTKRKFFHKSSEIYVEWAGLGAGNPPLIYDGVLGNRPRWLWSQGERLGEHSFYGRHLSRSKVGDIFSDGKGTAVAEKVSLEKVSPTLKTEFFGWY